MKTLLLFVLLFVPCLVLAAEECQVVELENSFEVTCTGDARPVSIPREAVTAAPMRAPDQVRAPQQNSLQSADMPEAAATQPATASKSAAAGGSYVKKTGRQGRPSSADMQAAIEARRKLIQESAPKD